MTEAHPSTCQACGKPFATVVAGLCARCLLGDSSQTVTIADVTGDPQSAINETMPILVEATGPLRPPGKVRPPDSRRALPALADRFARLELSDEIGRSGMGVVFRGRDHELERELAVKILRPDLDDSAEMTRRFVEEAQITGQLQHPGIVPIHQFGIFEDGRPYFTMKLVKGRTLSALLADGGRSQGDQDRFLGMFEQICQTVAYAHAHGVIHRDLKPSNVMVGSFGEVQVMDWGLAKVLARDASIARVEIPAAGTVVTTARGVEDSELSRPGSVLGTISYMAPEQARGEVERVDERADVFALGAILCKLLTGEPPFVGESGAELLRQAAEGNLADASARLDRCAGDAELVALARDCLAPERDERPRDAGVVAGRVTAYLAGVRERLHAAELARATESARVDEATRTAEVARAQARAERRARRLAVSLAVTGIGLIAIVAGGSAWLQQQDAHRIATTARLVNDALSEAFRLEGEARSRSVDDPAGWTVALAEAQRAEALLAQGRADAPLRARVDTLLKSLTRQRSATAERAARLRSERKLLADLSDARDQTGYSLTEVDRAYAAAFSAAGLDVDGSQPRAIGEWIAARPSVAELALFLDDWAHIRRWIKLKPGQHPDSDLVAAARVADPDPWRDRFRAAHRNPAALRALADDEQGLEGQPPRSLHLFAIALKDEASDLDRAMRVLGFAWQRFPNHFWINLEMAICVEAKMANCPPAQRTRWGTERARFLSTAFASRPHDFSTLYALADTFLGQGRLDDAVETYRGVNRLRPGTVAPNTRVGQLLRSQRRLDEAASAFREAIRSKPDDDLAHVELGNTLRDQNKLDESVIELREATRLSPENATWHFYYGMCLEALGRREESLVPLREAFRLDCKNQTVGSVPHPLSHFLRLVGRSDEAIDVLSEALRIKPDEQGIRKTLVDYLVRAGRLKEAAECQAPLCERNPDDWFAGFELSALYLAAGDDAAYRRHCLAMLDRYDKMPTSNAADFVTASCLLSPRPVEVERASQIARLTFDARAAAQAGTDEHGWKNIHFAWAEHRSGHFTGAAELLEGLKVPGKAVMLRADSLLALTEARLGRKEEASRRLADCRVVLAAGRDALGQPAFWVDWLVAELNCRETECLLVPR
jgi:tetratricopeptide (TPR) repeat protein